MGSGQRRTLGALAEDIDLIMRDRQCLAFIEVRCRQSSAFAMPDHTVDARKQRKIIRTAALFLSRERCFANSRVRFDVIAVEGNKVDNVRWIRDAFRPGDSAL